MTPTPDLDRTQRVDPPAECRECRAELTGATVLADGWAQVWDVLPAMVDEDALRVAAQHVWLRNHDDRAAQRLADTLERAGFDDAMKAALRAEPVLCGDESPVNVLETTSTRPPVSRCRARRTHVPPN